MPVVVTVPDDALAALKAEFVQAEGFCEAWTDEQVVVGMLVRGLMDYCTKNGRAFTETAASAKALREALTSG